MFNNRCGRQNFMAMPSQNGLIDIDNNTGNIDIDFAQTQAINQNDTMTAGTSNAPIMEPINQVILAVKKMYVNMYNVVLVVTIKRPFGLFLFMLIKTLLKVFFYWYNIDMDRK